MKSLFTIKIIMKKLLLIMFLLILLTSCTTPENIYVTKEYPNEVRVDDRFNIELTVSNKNLSIHELRSIDFDNVFLDWIIITKVSESIIEEYDAFWYHVYEFKKNIEKESDLKIIFEAKAIKSWDYSWDLDFCIDWDTSCIFNSIRIIVK